MQKLFTRLLTIVLVISMLAGVIAGEFNWEQCKGQSVRILLVNHPYAEGILKKIPDFEKKTGIKVVYSVIPEENYMDKLVTSLVSRSGDPDVFMSGPYQVWEYAPAGYLANIDEYLTDANKTSADYDVEDFFPSIIGAMRWDLIPGHKVGTGNLWGIPIGSEFTCLTYNKELYKKFNLKLPETPEELYENAKKLNMFAGQGSYGIAVRGTRNWATINTGYLTTFANYGAQDMAVENGRLVSKLNSPEAIKATDDWVKMIKSSGSPTWSSYTWYQCAADLGAGKAAMLFDADILGYFTNDKGASQESGKLAALPPVAVDPSKQVVSNLWTWALSINNYSRVKDASWLFVQYFTGKEFLNFSVNEWKSVDTPRKSVFNDPEFRKRIGAMEGYIEMFEKTVPGATILFTPNPSHFEISTEWAAVLQDLVAGKYASTEEGMNYLTEKINVILEDVDIE